MKYDKEQTKGVEYYSVSFQCGKGSVLQRSCSDFTQPAIRTLPPAPYNSFESMALTTGLDYFYYPTGSLSDRLLQLLSFPAYSDLFYGYTFGSPKQNFDAIVFIRESSPLRLPADQGMKAKTYLEKKSQGVTGR